MCGLGDEGLVLRNGGLLLRAVPRRRRLGQRWRPAFFAASLALQRALFAVSLAISSNVRTFLGFFGRSKRAATPSTMAAGKAMAAGFDALAMASGREGLGEREKKGWMCHRQAGQGRTSAGITRKWVADGQKMDNFPFAPSRWAAFSIHFDPNGRA